MAGAFTIQRFPKALSDFLGMKVGGDVPPELGQVVAPSLELYPFYALDRLTQSQANFGNIGATGAILVSTLTVPAGEVWDVTNVTVAGVFNAAGQALTIMPAIFYANTGGFLTVFSDSTYVASATVVGETWACGRQFDPGTILAPSGTQFGGDCVKLVLNASTIQAVQLAVTYFRYLV